MDEYVVWHTPWTVINLILSELIANSMSLQFYYLNAIVLINWVWHLYWIYLLQRNMHAGISEFRITDFFIPLVCVIASDKSAKSEVIWLIFLLYCNSDEVSFNLNFCFTHVDRLWHLYCEETCCDCEKLCILINICAYSSASWILTLCVFEMLYFSYQLINWTWILFRE